MIVLNFSHPLTDAQLQQLEALLGEPPARVVHVPVQFDLQRPFAEQVQELADSVALEPDAWQTEPLLINLPALNFIAALLLAELHGRMGYFPSLIRTRPVPGALPPRYEVVELLNLQQVRDAARERRSPGLPPRS